MIKKNSFFLLSVFILFTFSKVSSQNTEFEKTYSLGGDETGYACFRTFDNGFILTGSTDAMGSGLRDVYLARLDSNFAFQWTKIFGGALRDYCEYVRQTADSGFLLSGSTESFGSGGFDALLIRTDKQGTILWSKTFGGINEENIFKTHILSNGNIVVAGSTTSYGAGDWDMMIIMLNEAGDTLWTRIAGGPVFDFATSVTNSNDGNLVISGRSYSFTSGLRDAFIMKLDTNGNFLWFKSYGGIYTDEGMFISSTSDNGFIMTGATESFGAGSHDVYLIKTDSAGNLQWSKVYGGIEVDASYYVIQTADGGYALTGFTDSFTSLSPRLINDPPYILGDDSSHVLLIRTDSAGDTIWTRAYGGLLTDEAYSVFQNDDGGFILGAYSNSFTGSDSTDVYIIRTDSLGVSDCHTKYISPSVSSPPTITLSHTPTINSGIAVLNITPGVVNAVLQSIDPCLPISVEDATQNFPKDDVKIFPNPFSDFATVKILPEKNLSQPAYLSLFDLSGRLIKTWLINEHYLNNGEMKITSEGLTDGIYFIELSIGNETPVKIKTVITGSSRQ